MAFGGSNAVLFFFQAEVCLLEFHLVSCLRQQSIGSQVTRRNFEHKTSFVFYQGITFGRANICVPVSEYKHEYHQDLLG